MSKLLYFNGENTYIDVPLASPSNAGGAITIEFWNYVTATDAQRSYAFSFQTDTTGQIGSRTSCHAPWVLPDDHPSFPGKNIFWDYGEWDHGGRVFFNYKDYLDKWTHVALVCAGTNVAAASRYQAIYLNGKEVIRNNHLSDMLKPNDTFTRLLIGGDYEDNNTYKGYVLHHKGWMDEFRVWNTARTATQILDNMNKRMSGTEPNLVTCFNFNVEESPTELQNVVSKQPKGTLKNFSSSGLQSPSAAPIQTSAPVTPGNSYTLDQKVEVKKDGFWIAATYKEKVTFSNRKDTPHQVSFDYYGLSGTGYFSDADIRPWTGKLPSVKPQVDPSTVNTSNLENAIIVEINKMRKDPGTYAATLAGLKQKYVQPLKDTWYLDMPEEGSLFIGNLAERNDHEKWLDETITALKATNPGGKASPVLSQLLKNDKLRTAADGFASDAGKVDGPKHMNSKGRGAIDRMRDAGYNDGGNECIPGDCRTAFGTVAQLLIDWNVPGAGHRKNLMNTANKDIGVACHSWPKKDLGGRSIEEAYIRTVIQCGYGATPS